MNKHLRDDESPGSPASVYTAGQTRNIQDGSCLQVFELNANVMMLAC